MPWRWFSFFLVLLILTVVWFVWPDTSKPEMFDLDLEFEATPSTPSPAVEAPVDRAMEEDPAKRSTNTFVFHLMPADTPRSVNVIFRVCPSEQEDLVSCPGDYQMFRRDDGYPGNVRYTYELPVGLHKVYLWRNSAYGRARVDFEVMITAEDSEFEFDGPSPAPYSEEKEKARRALEERVRQQSIDELDRKIDSEEDPARRVTLEIFRNFLTGEMLEVIENSDNPRAEVLDLVQEAKEFHGVTEPIYEEEVTWLEEEEY